MLIFGDIIQEFVRCSFGFRFRPQNTEALTNPERSSICLKQNTEALGTVLVRVLVLVLALVLVLD